jgi:S1-C subfamily serine protease
MTKLIKNVLLQRFSITILTGLLAIFFAGNKIAFSQSGANEIYKRVSPTVVLIKTDKGSGSGFIVASTGVIATAFHVIDGASRVAVKSPSGDIYDDVSLLAKDERRDLALLKVSGFDLPTASLGNSNDVAPGDKVIVIGNPLGAEQLKTSISDGIVSGIRDLGEGYKVIQVTAPISPGNSGGPAFSANGDVIGVIVFRLTEGQSLNFAVPINYLRGMIASIDPNKPVSQWKNAHGSESVFSEKVSAKVSRWKSLQTGTTRILKFEGDYLYIENVLSEDDRKLGVFQLAELKKQGYKYVGTWRDRLVWWQKYPYSNEKVAMNSCNVETVMELAFVTPTRIEGKVLDPPQGAKLDKKKCTWSKPSAWMNFTWIPE